MMLMDADCLPAVSDTVVRDTIKDVHTQKMYHRHLDMIVQEANPLLAGYIHEREWMLVHEECRERAAMFWAAAQLTHELLRKAAGADNYRLPVVRAGAVRSFKHDMCMNDEYEGSLVVLIDAENRELLQISGKGMGWRWRCKTEGVTAVYGLLRRQAEADFLAAAFVLDYKPRPTNTPIRE